MQNGNWTETNFACKTRDMQADRERFNFCPTHFKKNIDTLFQNFRIFDNIFNTLAMKTMLILIISFVGIATFNSCEKLTNTAWVYYNETYCADAWGQNTVPEDEKKKNIEKYFKDKGIKIFKVEITDDGTLDLCESCGCKSGKRIKCKIKEDDVESMKKAGFYQ